MLTTRQHLPLPCMKPACGRDRNMHISITSLALRPATDTQFTIMPYSERNEVFQTISVDINKTTSVTAWERVACFMFRPHPRNRNTIILSRLHIDYNVDIAPCLEQIGKTLFQQRSCHSRQFHKTYAFLPRHFAPLSGICIKDSHLTTGIKKYCSDAVSQVGCQSTQKHPARRKNQNSASPPSQRNDVQASLSAVTRA